MNKFYDINVSKRIFKALMIFTLSSTAIGVILRLVSLFAFFEKETGYYVSDSILPIVYNVFSFTAVGIFLIAAFLLKKKAVSGTNEKDISIKVSSAISSAAFLFTAYSYIVLLLSESEGASTTRGYFFAAALALCSVYFLFNLSPKKNEAQPILVIVIVVALVFMAATSYFDLTVPMNSPNQILFNMACATSMLFFISEGKSYLKTENTVTYLFMLCSMTYVCGSYALPAIIYFGFSADDAYMLYSPIFFSFAVYGVTRILILLKRTELLSDKDDKTVTSEDGDTVEETPQEPIEENNEEKLEDSNNEL